MVELAKIEPRYLRSAIEFAVDIASEAQKRKIPVSFPGELKPQFSKTRIPTSSLGRLRRAIETDDTFRDLVAVGAIPELVDEVGVLWLKRPDNWESDAIALIRSLETAEQDAELDSSLRTSEKRRKAAEQAAVRTRAELVGLAGRIQLQDGVIDELRADLAKSDEEHSEMRSELIDVRNEARHALDRELAASKKLQDALAGLDDARAMTNEIPATVGESPSRVTEPNNEAEIAAAAGAARALADQLSALLADEVDEPNSRTDSNLLQGRRKQRVALSLPGGVIPSSAEAAVFFVRSDAEILIDGYNVAKLGWPRLDLEAQRNILLDAVEDLVHRYGADITVVFDGASVVGAHTGRRRFIRVVFSPEGVTADDVIRDEVRRIPATHAVAVVTNDAEIIRDVRAEGANTLPSNALFAIL